MVRFDAHKNQPAVRFADGYRPQQSPRHRQKYPLAVKIQIVVNWSIERRTASVGNGLRGLADLVLL